METPPEVISRKKSANLYSSGEQAQASDRQIQGTVELSLIEVGVALEGLDIHLHVENTRKLSEKIEKPSPSVNNFSYPQANKTPSK